MMDVHGANVGEGTVSKLMPEVVISVPKEHVIGTRGTSTSGWGRGVAEDVHVLMAKVAKSVPRHAVWYKSKT